MNSYYIYTTSLGSIGIADNGTALTRIDLRPTEAPADAACQETPLLKKAISQLQEYLTGERREFSLPLAPEGTAFQQKVWSALQAIPWGETRSYGQIAASVDCPKGARAVGMANNKNPLAIIIPCHRVIGANGRLVGYAGGLDMKKQLLELEK